MANANVTQDKAFQKRQTVFASSPIDRIKCFNLRYKVFVKELDVEDPCVNHLTRTYRDAEDEKALVFGVFEAGQALGTGRLNYLDLDVNPYRELYQLDLLEKKFPQQVGVYSKFAITPSKRKSRIFVELCKLMYRQSLELRLRLTLLGCRIENKKLYERLGFKEYAPTKKCGPHGTIVPLQLDIYDLEHLRKIRSPLATELENFLSGKQDQPVSSKQRRLH
jgi:hypothetical protein